MLLSLVAPATVADGVASHKAKWTPTYAGMTHSPLPNLLPKGERE